MIHRAWNFVKVSALFGGCWLAGAVALNLWWPGPWLVPAATAAAWLACVGLFAARARRRAGHVAPQRAQASAVSAAGATSHRPGSGGAAAAAATGVAAAAAGAGGLVMAAQMQDDVYGDLQTLAMPVINPTTGLPMVGDSTAGIDVGGNVYGSSPDDFSGTDSFASPSYDGGSFGSHGHVSHDFGGGGGGSFGGDPW